MKIAPHSCNKLCREAITTVEHRKPEGVKLYYTSEVDDCYELSTDGQRVCQILINFLTNAEKHTTQGEIRLHCSLTENADTSPSPSPIPVPAFPGILGNHLRTL